MGLLCALQNWWPGLAGKGKFPEIPNSIRQTPAVNTLCMYVQGRFE